MEVLSLKQRFAEMDRVEERAGLIALYGETLRIAGETAIRFDRERAARHQESLRRLAFHVNESPRVLLDPIHREFGALQTAYQREGEQSIEYLREQLASTSELAQQMMANLSSMSTAHHTDLETEISSLRKLEEIDDLARLRAEIASTALRMTASMESIKREHAIAIAQMRDEIQTLHRELSRPAARQCEVAAPVEAPEPMPARGSVSVPASSAEAPATGGPTSRPEPGMSPRELQAAIKSKAESGEAISLLIVWMRNLAQLFTRHPPELVIELMKTAAERLDRSLQESRLWAKWEDDSFLVCLPCAKPEAARTSADLTTALNQTYALSSGGRVQPLNLKVAVGVVDRNRGETADQMLGRVDQLIKNLRSRP
jgi:GGDEF domain-containing protein